MDKEQILIDINDKIKHCPYTLYLGEIYNILIKGGTKVDVQQFLKYFYGYKFEFVGSSEFMDVCTPFEFGKNCKNILFIVASYDIDKVDTPYSIEDIDDVLYNNLSAYYSVMWNDEGDLLISFPSIKEDSSIGPERNISSTDTSIGGGTKKMYKSQKKANQTRKKHKNSKKR